jgi:hypothetical protein
VYRKKWSEPLAVLVTASKNESKKQIVTDAENESQDRIVTCK